ncbi:MAG: hypothetical protein AAGC60_16765 [Acidobacteriota bacterium]
MHRPTTHLSKLRTALTLLSLLFLASAVLATPSTDEKAFGIADRSAVADEGIETPALAEEPALNRATTTESLSITYCDSKCDFVWEWCVEAGVDRVCKIIDYEWCLTMGCPQPEPTNPSIDQIFCCDGYEGFGSSSY